MHLTIPISLFSLLLFMNVDRSYAAGANEHLAQSLCEHQLDSRVRTFILHRSESDTYTYDYRMNQVIMIRGTTVNVVTPIGHGGEGDAYLVSEESRLMIAKIFKEHGNFVRALEAHQLFERYLPTIVEFDPEKRILLLEYTEGVPVESIVSEGHIYGLSEEEIEDIVRGYESWVSFTYPRGQGHTGLSFWEVNTLYSFKDQTFRLIDPY